MADLGSTYDEKELIQAAEVGDHERIASLLRLGDNVNRAYQSVYNEMALWNASLNGHRECIELLLDSGANVNAMDANGNTCLMLSAQHGHHDCVQLLLEKGANVNLYDQVSGRNAVYLAAKGCHDECVDLLIKAGADVNKTPSGNDSLLGLACIKRNCMQRFTGVLIQAGADVNCRDGGENTPLLRAAWMGDDRSVDLLIQAGADVNVVNKAGSSPLMMAANRGGSIDRIRSLLLAGAYINNPRGWCRLTFKINSFNEKIKDELAMLLFAAGETLSANIGKSSRIPGYVKDLESELRLKYICRKAIRAHFIKMSPTVNLFVMIPRLGLPKSVSSYLLFDVVLHESDI